jgi:hypothetical protein
MKVKGKKQIDLKYWKNSEPVVAPMDNYKSPASVFDEEPKEEVEKVCDTCEHEAKQHNEIPCSGCSAIHTVLHWKPKLADEKPKVEKVKNVCDWCGKKCKLVVIDEQEPIYCPYSIYTSGYWKLKKEKV